MTTARSLAQRATDTISVKDYGARGDNVIDDTAAIQAAITAAPAGTTIYFPAGTYKVTSQLLISGKSQITLLGARGAKILFTDGAYIGLLFTGASGQCKLENLMVFGTNTSTPAITLVKSTGNAAYFTIVDCQFAYASIGVLLAQTYICKLARNNYSNCDRSVQSISSEGSNADHLLEGETFGTNLIGSNPVVDAQCVETRVVGCYFETTSHTKPSVIFRTGTQRAVFASNQVQNSGEIQTETSNTVTISGNTIHDCYSNNRAIRVAGGAVAIISGNAITFTSVIASTSGISGSGTGAVTGNFISRCATGGSMLDGTVSGNVIANCTLGWSAAGANTARIVAANTFLSNTTDIDTTSGTNVVAFNFATTGAIGVNTGTYVGNAPRQNDYKRAMLRGVTGSRPTLDATQQGVQYLDTTLSANGRLITWTGTLWVDSTGTSV